MALLLGLAVATCRDNPAGPGRGQRGYLALAPVLPEQANLAAFGLSIDSLRVVVVRPPSDTLVDTTVAFAADQDSISLALPLTLEAESEIFDVALELRGSGFVLFSATASVEVEAGAPGTSPPVEISDFEFIGPGAGITSLFVTPADSVIRLGDSLRFRVDAFIGQVPVTQFYVSWSTDNETLAPINAHGVLEAPNQRGRVLVTATTPTGVTGSAPVTFIPVPVGVVAVLPIPDDVPPGQLIGGLRAQVLAADGLGVKGIPVTFRSISGGGGVTDSVVVSDSLGFAQTTALSGITAGENVFSATVTGVAAPALFNVTVVSGVGTQLAFAFPPAGSVTDLPFGAIVEIRDAQGAVATSATDAVTIALGANPGDATLGGTLTVNAVQGIAVFGDLTLNQPGVGYTVVATSPAYTPATSPPFDVIPGFTGRLWTNPAGGNWSDPANWSGGTVPVAGDLVYVTLDGDYTVTLDVSASVGYLFFGGGNGTPTLAISSHTLGVDSGAVFNVGSVLNLANATISTAATAIVASHGTIEVAPGASAINSQLFVNAGSVLRLVGNNGPGVLSNDRGVLNFGTIELTGQGWGGHLSVTNGTLLNGPGATLQVVNGAGNIYTGALDNQGTVQVDGPWTLAAASADHFNSGTIALGAGDWTLAQTGTLPTFTTTGLITVGSGRTWTVNGGTVHYASPAAGGLDGLGTIALNGASLNLTPALRHDTLTLSLTNATVNGPGTLTVAGTTPLVMAAATVNAPFVNQGTVQVRPGANSLTGSVSNQNGGLLRLFGDNGPAVLTVASGFTNQGTIELSGAGWGGQLTVTSGALVNQTGATLRVVNGAGNSYTGILNNQGAVQVDGPWTVSGPDADHANAGTIAVGTGDWSLIQTGSTPSFTTTGTVTVEQGRTWTVNGGAVNYQTGTIGGKGLVAMSGATLGLGVSLTHDTLSLSLTNSTVNGPGTLTVAGQATLGLNAVTLNAALVNQGTVQVNPGANSFAGAVTNQTGALLRLLGNNGPAVVTVANGFTNDGTIELTGQGWGGHLSVTNGTLVNAPAATLRVLNGAGNLYNGTLDNQGTVQVDGPWALDGASADHLNSGSIVLGTGDWTLNQSGTTPSFTTTGTVTVGLGRTWTVNGGAVTYQSGALGGKGVVALNTATLGLGVSLTHDTLSLSLTTATVDGPGTLTVAGLTPLVMVGSTVNAALANQGTLHVEPGSHSLNGAVSNASGALLRLIGNNGPAVVTVANGFTNQGTIELTGQGWGGNLIVTSGTLVNAPGATLRALNGAGNAFDGMLNNLGTVQVDGPLTLTGAGADHDNSGSINVFGGDLTITQSGITPTFTNQGAVAVGTGRTLTTTGGAFTNDVAGTLSGSGTFDVSATTFNNSGTVAAGGSPGTLTFAGAYSMSASAVLSVEIGGTAPGTQYDQVVVSGTGTLGGTLNVSLINGFTPAIGNTFTVLTAGGLTGGFGLQNFPVVAGASWQVATAGNTVVLSLVSSTQAAVKTWNNLAGGVWSNPANWTPTGVPTALDSVVITAAAPYTVTVDVAANAFFLNLGAPIGAGGQTLALAAPTLTLATGALVHEAGVLSQSGGTLTGGGDVVIQSAMNWSGGTVSGVGSLTVSPGGTLTLSGGAHSLVTRSLLNQGSVVWTAGNIHGSSTTLQNAGLFDIQAAAATILWASGTTPVFENLPAGLVRRSAGTGAAVFDVTLNQAGSFEVETGRIELTRGSTSTADFVVQLGTTLEFAAGTHVLQTGVDLVGTGVVELTNATLDLAATDTVQVSRLHQLGGTLLGASVLRPDSLVWTAGTQSGTGATHVAAGATLLVGGAVSWQRPLVNQGTILWTAGNIAGGSATLLNTGLFDMQAPTATLFWSVGSTPVLDNQGTVLRRVGTGTLTVDVTLNNAGTFDVQTGRVEFTRGGTTSTDLTVQPGTTLEFAGGTYVLGTSADIVGTGLVELTSAVLDIAATDTVQVSRLHQLGGTLQGVGVLRPDSLVWSAGLQAGTGSTHIAAGATLLVNGGVSWQRPLVNQGTILWTSGNIAGGPVTLLNTGLFDMQPTIAILLWSVGGVPPVLDNQGTVLRRVGTGALTVDVTLNQTGTFDVQSGRVELTRGGSITSDLTVQPGTTLEFAGGTYTLNTGMDVVGTGLVELTGAVVDVAAADTVQMSRLHQLGGTLQGAGVVRPDSLVWSAGLQTGTGATHIAAAATLLVNGGVSWQRPLVNQGTILWTSGNIAGGPVTLLNTGLFDMQPTAATLLWAVGGTPPVLNNQGTVLRRVGTGALTVDVTLTHTGTFDVQTGRVELTRGGSSTTDFSVQPGTTLEFAGGNYTLGTGSDFVGTGLVEVTGAVLDLTATDTVRVTRMHQLGGTVQGTGVLRPDSLVWSAGQQAGTGATHIAAGTALLVTGSITLNRPLTNQGTLRWTAGNISAGAVTLQNTGLFDVRAVGTILIGGGTPLVLNNAGGTVLRSGSTGLATVNAVTNNDGTLDVQTGTLSLERGGSSTGSYTVSGAAATLRFGGAGAHTLGAGAKINGVGLVNFTGVDVSMSGTGTSYDVVGQTQIGGGIVTLDTPDTVRFATLNQLGGTLRGSAPMRVSGVSTWSGGNLEGPTGAGLRIPVGASLAITGAATKGFTGRTILASGSVSWIGGSINAAAGAVLDMQANTTFDVSSNGQWSGPSTIEIRSLANMKVTTVGSVTIGPATVLNIDGTLDIQAGATLKNSGDFNLLGRGILMGSGVLDVGGSPKVTNLGTVRPGASGPGILTIVAPPSAAGWPQASGTILDLEIFGPAEGTGFDKLVIIGRITTGGSLRLIGNGTYQPRTLSLQIMTFGSQVGQTFGVSLLGGLTGLLGINYSLTDLRMAF